jgi:inosine/xanthosine triphosphatase
MFEYVNLCYDYFFSKERRSLPFGKQEISTLKKKHIKVVVGSNNPVKINAANSAVSALYDDANVTCEGIHAPSGVADQPMSSEETLKGAVNRVKFCKQQIEADFYIAMEGGVDMFEYGPATFAYFVIADKNHQSVGRSAILPLPPAVYRALQEGQELGDVMDSLFNTNNIKQKGGAIGLLTNGCATRESNYTQAIKLAFAPFLHPHLYPNKDA